ncbi:MAG: hypothetical protein AB7S68_06235 [Polyangiaceae bacterium]
MRRLGLCAIAVCSSFGCSDVELSAGLDDSLRVDAAQFQRGALPGGINSDSSPRVSSLSLERRVFVQGTSGHRLTGLASRDAYSVALALDGGSGYWVRPVAGADPAAPDSLTWDFEFGLAADAEPGIRSLRVVALDESGQAGGQAEAEVCVADRIPDNLNACDPGSKPPALVVVLEWQGSADLDLRVVTPTGAIVDRHHTDAGGELKLDDGIGCTGEAGLESIVFEDKPTSGLYQVFVVAFEPCSDVSGRYQLKLRTASNLGSGQYSVDTRRVASGVIPLTQGRTTTFVAEFRIR